MLKLQACKYLTDTSLEPLYKKASLPALQELDLSYGTLGQSAIEELLTYCTHLTHVSLNGCVNMHDLNWGSSGGHPLEPTAYGSYGIFSQENVHESMEHPDRLLQNLNCVGCPNIRKVLIPPQARCFHLSSLNLSLSANLKEVDVDCITLCFLNLRYVFTFFLIYLIIYMLYYALIFYVIQQLLLVGNIEACLSKINKSVSSGMQICFL